MRRLVFIAVVAGCTINGSGPASVTARPPPDPSRMSSATLDHQDPKADTSKHPVLSRTSAHYTPPTPGGSAELNDGTRGCLGALFSISPGDCVQGHYCDAGRRGDASGLLLIAAIIAVTRRRRRTV